MKPRPKNKNIIDVTEFSFSDWLKLMKDPQGKLFIDYQFPNEKIKKECLDKAAELTDETFKLILRKFLFPVGQLGTDNVTISAVANQLKTNPRKLKEDASRNRFLQRVVEHLKNNTPIWPGIDWVEDLLPTYPLQAISTVEAFLSAHILWLPDGRIIGLDDATALIRARYITHHHDKEFLMTISPRDFEHLIDELYFQMGYQTKITKPTRDGGRDVIATKNGVMTNEELLIECKLVSDPVGFGVITKLFGVVASGKATKGVVVSTAGFTQPAVNFRNENKNRIGLIEYSELDTLLNTYLGPHWPEYLSEHIRKSKERNKKTF
jgi:restriction system protein